MAESKPKGRAKAEIEDEISQSVYINPLTDFGFKKLFLDKDLMIAFLNDVVGAKIKDITYQPNEGLGEFKEERIVVFDLMCTTDKNEYFIVEMQLGRQTFFRDRALFYASHAIRKQAPKRKYWNYELKAVYIVSVLDFITFSEDTAKDKVVERVYLYRENANMRYSDKLNMIFVELPKFNKEVTELRSNTDIWLYLLKNTYRLQGSPKEITGEIFKRFLELAEIKQLTSTEMETYRESLRHNNYLRDMANCERIEGHMKGRTEGLAEGLLKGRMEGRTEGSIERSRQIAIRLLQKKMSIDDVAALTDLTKEQVQKLQKNN